MCNLLFASINGKAVIVDYQEFFRLTFSPFTKYEVVGLAIKGKTYQERKEDARSKAVKIQYLLSISSYHYYLLSRLCSFLELWGKRYGLLEEFRENGLL